ncbi:MAG: L-ribulose-5-phosphate 4-epimerase [Terrimicrobiaceae bacterium]
MKFSSLREECCLASRELGSSGLVDLTFGNASLCSSADGVFAIKPIGATYHSLTPSDIVVLDMDGTVVAGKLRPSSDEPTHRCLLKSWAETGVRSVVHTHSRHAVAFAQAAQPLPCLGTTHSDYFRGPVPVTRSLLREEIQDDYEWKTGCVILETFSDTPPLDCPAVLVRSHGPFAWGESWPKALENAFALEIVAQMALATYQANPAAPPIDPNLLEKHFTRKHGPSAYYGQK